MLKAASQHQYIFDSEVRTSLAVFVATELVITANEDLCKPNQVIVTLSHCHKKN